MARRCIMLLFVLLLAACATTTTTGEQIVADRQKQAEALAKPAPPAPPAAVVHDSGSVLGTLAVSRHGDHLPPQCEQEVVLRSARPMDLPEIASRLSQILQLPVQIEMRGEHAAEARRPKPANLPPGPPPSFPAGDDAIAEGAGFHPDFKGRCADLLDRIAGHFDVDWRMRDRTLLFDRFVVRTFPLRASATTSQFSSTMSSGGNTATASAPSSSTSGGGNAASSAGGSAQSASVSANSDVWGEIESGLKTVLASGGKYSISRATGTVTIMAPPRLMADAADYIDQINKILGTTIAVEVSAIYVTVNDTDNYGLDLNALYQVGAQKLSLSGLLPTLSQAPGTGSVAILSPPAGTNNFSTHFAGSQLFLNAVSSTNRLADFRSATVTGRNGVAMPITLTTNQDIVRSLQFAVGLQSGAASTSASTTTINYGFTLQVLPRVIAPGVVSVFLSFNANDLTNLQDFAVGTAGSLELATIDSRALWNESPLRVGQTLVIAGTEQEKVNPQRSGIGSAANWVLGGQYKNEVIRTRLILLVTPSIMATPS